MKVLEEVSASWQLLKSQGLYWQCCGFVIDRKTKVKESALSYIYEQHKQSIDLFLEEGKSKNWWLTKQIMIKLHFLYKETVTFSQW